MTGRKEQRGRNEGRKDVRKTKLKEKKSMEGRMKIGCEERNRRIKKATGLSLDKAL